ncbi:MAG: CAP domain-containing protein [Chloroflexi bacterium]|nr:CAP domain-containing protein [Chloroflexota bacterium]
MLGSVLLAAVSLVFWSAHRGPAGVVHASTGACAGGDPSLDPEESALVARINEYRAQQGLRPLAVSEELTQSAAWMAADLSARSAFDHVDSAGRDPGDRGADCGYPFGVGEVLAAGTFAASAGAAFQMWRDSSPHNANLLNPAYAEVGVARAYGARSTYGWYWVADFGLGAGDVVAAGLALLPSGIESATLVPGAWNIATVLPGGVLVRDLEGWTAWDELPGGWWQEWEPGDVIPGGREVGLLPLGQSMDLGRNPR